MDAFEYDNEINRFSLKVRDYLMSKKTNAMSHNQRKELQSLICFFKKYNADPDLGERIMNEIDYNDKIVTYAIIGQILIALGNNNLISKSTGRNCKIKLCIHTFIAANQHYIEPILRTIALYSRSENDTNPQPNEIQETVNRILDQLNEDISNESGRYKNVVSLEIKGVHYYFAIHPNKKSVKFYDSDGNPFKNSNPQSQNIDNDEDQNILSDHMSEHELTNEPFDSNDEDNYANANENTPNDIYNYIEDESYNDSFDDDENGALLWYI